MSTSFKYALITGATSGIGEALARKLAKEKVALFLTGRSHERLQELKEELGQQVAVSTETADLAVQEEREKIIQWIRRAKPDLVINNAGVGLYGSIAETEKEEQLNVVEVNVMALTELTIETVKTFVQANKKGVILNVSSVAGFTPFPCFATYAASKAYVNSFSRAVDIEVQPLGIRVLTTCPGMVDTQFGKRASHGEYQSTQNKMTPTFAAEEIWKQIQKEKQLYIFNFRYRIGTFLLRFLSSHRWLLRRLQKVIKDRVQK